jgi:type IV pilus assembly protein PilV
VSLFAFTQEASAMNHKSRRPRSWNPLQAAKRRSRGAEGFTLLEILVALVILSVGVLGYMAVQFQSVSGRAFARSLHRAMTTGITDLEDKRLLRFADLSGEDTEYVDKVTGDLATATDYAEGQAYKVEWRVGDWTNVSANPNCFINEMKTLQVVVHWKEKGMDYSSAFFTVERGRKVGDAS